MPYPLENALFQWEEGWRGFQELDGDPAMARRAHRAIGLVQDELRRRIGPTFAAGELADLYALGTDWTLEAAMREFPGGEVNPALIADAAFWLYLRGATDFAGGRQLAVD